MMLMCTMPCAETAPHGKLPPSGAALYEVLAP